MGQGISGMDGKRKNDHYRQMVLDLSTQLEDSKNQLKARDDAIIKLYTKFSNAQTSASEQVAPQDEFSTDPAEHTATPLTSRTSVDWKEKWLALKNKVQRLEEECEEYMDEITFREKHDARWRRLRNIGRHRSILDKICVEVLESTGVRVDERNFGLGNDNQAVHVADAFVDAMLIEDAIYRFRHGRYRDKSMGSKLDPVEEIAAQNSGMEQWFTEVYGGSPRTALQLLQNSDDRRFDKIFTQHYDLLQFMKEGSTNSETGRYLLEELKCVISQAAAHVGSDWVETERAFNDYVSTWQLLELAAARSVEMRSENGRGSV